MTLATPGLALAIKVEDLLREELQGKGEEERFADACVALQIVMARQLARVPHATQADMANGALIMANSVAMFLTPGVRASLMKGGGPV